MQPSDQDADAQTLAALKRAGSDLSKPHPLDFYLCFPTKKDAQEVAKVLSDEGYQVKVALGADDVSWLCLASTRVVPTLATLASIGGRFEALVQPRGGEYDGWEAAVVK